MVSKIALNYANILIVLSCLALTGIIVRKGLTKIYVAFLAFLAVRGLTALCAVALLYHRRELGLTPSRAYELYFYSYWPLVALQLALQMFVIYSIYHVAMKPLDGLKRMGTIIFRWVSTVSLFMALLVALGPHEQGGAYYATLVGQAQEGVCILTVCLLVFVCFAAQPLGLTYRSRAFGILLGLGFTSTASLVLSAWATTSAARTLYSPIYAIGAVVSVVSLFIWGGYFAIPEPERKMVMLPTTSPYFLWNSISEALGDDPGMVAVAGFTPSMMAPAEMLALAASTESHSMRPSLVEPMLPLASSM